MKAIFLTLAAMVLITAARAQRPVPFSQIPGGMKSCNNRYYLTAADKSRGRLIWVDDFDKGALMVNGKLEKLKNLKFPDKNKYGFFNKNYTVSIYINKQQSTSGHTYTAAGSIRVFRGNRVIYTHKVIAAGGC